MTTKPAYKGPLKTIEYLVADDGSCAVEAFVEALERGDRKKVDVLFEMMGLKGRISNKEKFKKLEGSDNIWEFKSFQIRLLCFMAPGNKVIICRAQIKKKARHDRADIEFAEACRKKYLGES